MHYSVRWDFAQALGFPINIERVMLVSLRVSPALTRKHAVGSNLNYSHPSALRRRRKSVRKIDV
jgi:hypothetical protein